MQDQPNKSINQARQIVRNNILLLHDKTNQPLGEFDVYVVWFCKVIQNWKALCSTTLPDGKYYEVTFDGDKDCAYLDTYVWGGIKKIGGRDPMQDGTVQKPIP